MTISVFQLIIFQSIISRVSFNQFILRYPYAFCTVNYPSFIYYSGTDRTQKSVTESFYSNYLNLSKELPVEILTFFIKTRIVVYQAQFSTIGFELWYSSSIRHSIRRKDSMFSAFRMGPAACGRELCDIVSLQSRKGQQNIKNRSPSTSELNWSYVKKLTWKYRSNFAVLGLPNFLYSSELF